MDTAHRRIELQSLADYNFITHNTSQAAQARIDAHFSDPSKSAAAQSSPDQTPPTRAQIEAAIQTFLGKTFAHVEHNISINGLEGADMQNELRRHGSNPFASESGPAREAGQDMEAFDSALARRVQSAASRVEELQLALANMRRSAAGKGRERYEAEISQGDEAWEAKMEGLEKADEERREAEGEVVHVQGLERVGEMRRSWEEGLAGLIKVKGEVGEVVGRLERAKTAVGVLSPS